MDATSTERMDAKSFSWGRWCLIFVGCFLIYILGSGPAYKLGDRGVLPWNLVDIIYRPLGSFCFAHGTAGKIYVKYLRLWGEPVIDPVTGLPVHISI